MNATATVFYQNYSPVGDILVLVTCLIFVILIHAAYVNRTKSFRIFRGMLSTLMVACAADLLFYTQLPRLGTVPPAVLYALRTTYHLALFANLAQYVHYIAETMHLERRVKRRCIVAADGGVLVLLSYEILGTALRFGYYIDDEFVPHMGFPVFPLGYAFFTGIVLFLAIRYRGRIYKQVMRGILATVAMSFLLLYIQVRHDQLSFTTASFLFPVLALLYLVHANPYDVEMGAVNVAGFEEYIKDHRRRGRELLLMSLMLPQFESSGKKYPIKLQETIRGFVSDIFRGALLFQVSNGRMILTAEIARNPDYEVRIRRSLEQFSFEDAKFRLEYKIVITLTSWDIGADGDFVNLIRYVEEHMPVKTICTVGEQDIERYREHRYIISELADIHARHNMNDSRVEVYCQPVLNLRTGKYDTAEALMRLRLDKLPLVMPNRFIPLAEKHNYITVLSMIILSKTCAEIKRLLDRGYAVERISVNFSMIDLRDPEFASVVSRIIRQSDIPCEKVAIELTESQNERDFMLVKERIGQLHESGIKFYLDDFGTGYSNFERIMELPFDIIKFDRSLVLASANDGEKNTMVSYLARMFSDMGYSVLYEGVETDVDEDRCTHMCAKYLQGNLFSAPIPIERLTDYFERPAG